MIIAIMIMVIIILILISLLCLRRPNYYPPRRSWRLGLTLLLIAALLGGGMYLYHRATTNDKPRTEKVAHNTPKKADGHQQKAANKDNSHEDLKDRANDEKKNVKNQAPGWEASLKKNLPKVIVGGMICILLFCVVAD